MTCITWNCEGFRRVSSELLSVSEQYKADFIFISEPHLFQADLAQSTSIFNHHFCSSLNSADKLDHEIPLKTSRAFGGTLTLWRRSLDPYVKIIDVHSSNFLVILLTIPGYPVTVHVNIYLPTSGLDAEYVSELSKLENTLDEIDEEFENPIVMIRGDANAAIPIRPNNSRDTLFQYFCSRMALEPVLTNHKTYHHFMGGGLSDSAIDVFLQRSNTANISEKIEEILCSKSDSRVDSKHDIIISRFSLPYTGHPPANSVTQPPRIQNTKHRIVWSEDGICDYRSLLSPTLLNIQENWKNPPSPISFSVLLQCTNEALATAAKITNKVVDLTKDKPPKKVMTPPEVTAAASTKKAAHSKLQELSAESSTSELELSTAKANFSDARKAHRRVWRRHQAADERERDRKLSAMSSNPSEAFKHLKSVRSSSISKISEIKVGDETYYGKDVAIGFYNNIHKLKTELDPAIEECTACKSFKFDHKLITEICRAGEKIPPLNLEDAEKLLHSLKPSVCDHWNISAAHYVNGGPVALKHYQILINTALKDIENTSVDEVNTAHACILFKGHQKDKTLASSYRTISSCPFIAKSCDTYIRSLSVDDWHDARADVQFLGPGMSHEMGALLLSEVIQHSINVNNKPLYALFLDARSAFDRALR